MCFLNTTLVELFCAFSDLAVAAARAALEEGPWSKMTGRERRNLLNKLAQLVDDNADELALAESQDNGSIVVCFFLYPSKSTFDSVSTLLHSAMHTGKPVAIAKAVDVSMTAEMFRYFAGWADRLEGKQSPIDGVCCALRITHGVCVFAHCLPWCRQLPVLHPPRACGCGRPDHPLVR